LHKFFRLLLPFAMLIAAAGCADKSKLGMSIEQPSDNKSGFTIECSISLLPLARSFAEKHSADAVAVAVGKEAAIASVAEGRSDIALYGGDASVSEGLTAVIIGAEVVRLLTGSDSARANITLDEIYALFVDEAIFEYLNDWDEDWSDWDDTWEDWEEDWDDWDDWGEDTQIDPEEKPDRSFGFVHPEEKIAIASPGAYSRLLFEELFGLRDNVNGVMKSLIPTDANIFENDNAVIDYIKANPDTIGVVINAAEPAGVKSLSIDSIKPGEENYIGRREIVLLYKNDNAEAAAFAELLQSGVLDELFLNNNVLRTK